MKILTRLFIVSGILFILTPLWTNLYTSYYQREMRKYINTEQNFTLPEKMIKSENGYKPFSIEIPQIKINSIVVEGTDKSSLKKGPGHYTGSTLPGQKGNMIIAGHRTTYGRVFFNLDKLKKGDEISFYFENKKYNYQVTEKKIIKPSDISVLKDTGETKTTLITCEPVYSAQKRLVIIAKMK